MENEVISYVYFSVSEDRSGFKIGVSQNPLRRNTQFSEKIDLLNSIKFSCQKSDAFRIEKSIHFLFDKNRLQKDKGDGYTEWFDFSAFDEISNFVINNKDKFKWITCEPITKEFEAAEISDPDYVKMYVADLSNLVGLKEGHGRILPFIASSVGYDGFISLSGGRKARIAMTAGCSLKSVNNAITEYVKAGILIRAGRAEYELNPHLFAKGEWRNIRERRLSFTAKINYSSAGRTIEVCKDE
jgi:hypothetical protein